MKTLLFCTSLLTEDSLFKQSEWWKYYRNKFPEFDFLIMNDGPVEQSVLNKLMDLTDNDFKENNIITFEKKLGRESHYHWGWYRSFLKALSIGRDEYDKIIHIESDAVIVSERLTEYLKNENTGWRCMYSEKYFFGESAIQIINSDSFHLIDRLDENFDFHTIAECILPFRSNKTFVGDRYGEDGRLPSCKIDYACQWDWNWLIDQEWIL